MADQRRNAGNIGDVIKHSLLPQLVQAFDSCQEQPWTYCETHAGYYDYSLLLLKNEGRWKGERAWSVGVIENCEGMTRLGGYGAELAKSFEEGVYPGSMRIVASAVSTLRLKRLVGWDIGDEQVTSYASKLKRILVQNGDGYRSVGPLQDEPRLVFCDPFWDEEDADNAKVLINQERHIVVWYPLSVNTNQFRQWCIQQPYPRLEVYYRNWTANRYGWAAQDMKGAGMLVKGLPDGAIQNAIVIAKVLKALFEGKKHQSRPRRTNERSSFSPQDRDLSLGITVWW